MIMKKIFLVSLVFFLFSSSQFPEEKITIAVAANAQFAMKEIEKQYEKQTGKNVELIISSSGKLTAQIREGAPYDIFLSADMEYPQVLFKEGLAAEPKVYAFGSLVLWTCKSFASLNINSLLSSEVKTIAIANPKVAPYGEAAISVMKYYKVYEKAESKLVYGESISQVTHYITTQSADMGFTAKSVVLSPEMQGKGKWIDLDKRSYQPIEQGAVILNSSAKRNRAGVEDFYKYIFSESARKIFRKYGYEFER